MTVLRNFRKGLMLLVVSASTLIGCSNEISVPVEAVAAKRSEALYKEMELQAHLSKKEVEKLKDEALGRQQYTHQLIRYTSALRNNLDLETARCENAVKMRRFSLNVAHEVGHRLFLGRRYMKLDLDNAKARLANIQYTRESERLLDEIEKTRSESKALSLQLENLRLYQSCDTNVGGYRLK